MKPLSEKPPPRREIANVGTTTSTTTSASATSATSPSADAIVDGALSHAGDAFGAEAHAGDAVPPIVSTGPSAGVQMLALRARPTKATTTTTTTTAGGRLAMLGLDLLLPRAPKSWSGAAIAAAMLGLFSATNSTTVPAETLYINVNGATKASAELRGVTAASAQHHEKLVVAHANDIGAMLQAVTDKDPLRKLVISGHSSGAWVNGEDADGAHSVGLSDIQALAQKYPQPIAQVKLFFAMACNIGTEENSRQWMAPFTNAKAFIGFDHIGPASTEPAAEKVLNLVDAELSKVDFDKLDRASAAVLAARLSLLPGVNQTEFSIRLRANDGSTVFFSKLNKPTSASAATDLVDQLRESAFIPFRDAADDAHKNPPPTGHDDKNPVRQFYNATQDLLSALGRDLSAQGLDPKNDEHYQKTVDDKEAALKLIYFPVIVQNVERNLRPEIDAVTAELKAAGFDVAVPKLTTQSRQQILAIANAIDAHPAYLLARFVPDHQADADLVKQHIPGGNLKIDEKTTIGRLTMVKQQLATMVADSASAPDVRAAAQRLLDAAGHATSPAFDHVRAVLVDGLRDLKAGAFPTEWITAENQRQ